MKARYNPFAPPVRTPAPPKPSAEDDAAKAARAAAADAEVIAKFNRERGIPVSEIKPRENVLTFRAWLKHGRAVRKGEKGIRVGPFTLFHVSQTGDPKQKTPAASPIALRVAPCWICKAPTGRFRNLGARTPVWCDPCFATETAKEKAAAEAAAAPALPPPAASWRDRYLARRQPAQAR